VTHILQVVCALGKKPNLWKEPFHESGFFGVRFSRGEVDAGDDSDDISVFSCRGVVGEIRAEA
jgi:hypothetical protein